MKATTPPGTTPAGETDAGPTVAPGPRSRAVIERLRAVEGAGLRTGADAAPLVIASGSGATLVDVDGQRYTDLYASFAAANLGHAHPEVTAAIVDQAGRLTHASSAFVTEQRVTFEEALVAAAPSGLDRVLLGISGADANELAAMAEAGGRVLMVDHLLVYHPAVQKLRDLVTEGTLGQVFYLYGNRQNLGIVRPDENALWSLGPHDISVMLHLVGERPTEVAASGESYLQPGVEDVVFGRIRFPSGILGHLHLSWLDPHKMRKMTVIGSEKMVVFDDMETERKVTIYDKGPIPRTATSGEYIQVRSGDIHIPKIPAAEPLRIVCARFVQAVTDRRPTPSDGWAGAAVVEVLEAMTTSLAQSGAPVSLAPATPSA